MELLQLYSLIYLLLPFLKENQKIHKLKTVSRKWICSKIIVAEMDAAVVGKSLCYAIVRVLL